MPRIGFYGGQTRLWDLRKGQYLVVECGNCGHKGSVTPGSLPSRIRPADVRLCDLPKLLRCTWCKRISPNTEVTVVRR